MAKQAPRILGVSLAAGALAYILLMPDSYEASARIQLPDGSDYAAAVTEITGQPLLARAAAELPPDLVATLRQSASDTVDITFLLGRHIDILGPDANGVIRLRTVARNRTSAMGVINAVAGAYLGPDVDLAAIPDPVEPRLNPDPVGSIDTRWFALQDEVAEAIGTEVGLESRAELAERLLQQGNYYVLAREFDTLGVMTEQVEQLAALQSERTQLSVTLLANHPKMRTANEQVASLTSLLRTEGQALVDAVRAELGSAKTRTASLKTEIASLPEEVAIDDTILTGSINAGPRLLAPVSATAVDKLIKPGVGGGAAAILAFFAQLALLRRPSRNRDEALAAEDETQPDLAPEGDAEPDDIVPTISEFSVLPVATVTPTVVEPEPEPVVETEPAPTTFAEAEDEDPEDDDAFEPLFPFTPAPEAEPSWFAAAPAEPVAEPSFDHVDVRIPSPPAKRQARPRIVVVSSSVSAQSSDEMIAELLVALRQRDRRVAVIDAGSHRRTSTAGISDLASGRASYADVIQYDDEQGLTFVSWGRRGTVDLDTEAVAILLKALSTLCDAVIVNAGKIQHPEQLPLLSMNGVIHTSADSALGLSSPRAAA